MRSAPKSRAARKRSLKAGISVSVATKPSSDPPKLMSRGTAGQAPMAAAGASPAKGTERRRARQRLPPAVSSRMLQGKYRIRRPPSGHERWERHLSLWQQLPASAGRCSDAGGDQARVQLSGERCASTCARRWRPLPPAPRNARLPAKALALARDGLRPHRRGQPQYVTSSPAVRRCAGQRLSRPAEPRFTRAREPALAGGCRRALGSGWAGAGARHARRAAVSRCARRHGAGHGLGRAGAAVRRLAAHRGGLARPVLPVRGPAGAAAARGGGGGGRGAGAARRASCPAVAAGAVAAGLGASPQQPGAPARGTAGRGAGGGAAGLWFGLRGSLPRRSSAGGCRQARREPAALCGPLCAVRARRGGCRALVNAVLSPRQGAMEPADVAAWTFPQQPLFPLIPWHDSGIDL